MQNYSEKNKSDLKTRAYHFGLGIIRLTDELPHKRSSWVIADQLIRAATSIGANTIEARAASSKLEFKKFYEIALKSANESRYWLALLVDAGLVPGEKTEPFVREVSELANMLGASVLTLKGKRRI